LGHEHEAKDLEHNRIGADPDRDGGSGNGATIVTVTIPTKF
jgi:hypothetical protein